jgi:hypothetical protein
MKQSAPCARRYWNSLVRSSRCLLLACLLALVCGVAKAEPSEVLAAVDLAETPTDEKLELRLKKDEPPNEARWFWHLGLTSAFPRIESEKLITNIYDPIMEALAPGYDDVTIIGDYRDFGLLLAPQIGIGRRVGDHLTLTIHGGWAGGKVRTIQDTRSWIFLLPFHNDFEIFRGASYVDVAADVYPLGHPKLLDYETWRERFKAARPKAAISTTFTNAEYQAKVKIGFGKLPNIGVTVTDEWLLQSYKPRIGLEIPINRRNVLSFDLAYNFFEELQYDFNGPIVSVIWQHYWKR